MWFIVVSSFVSGVVCTLFIELFFLYQWWIRKPIEKPTEHVRREKVRNPEQLAKYFKMLSDMDEADAKEKMNSPETCVCLNAIFAFLWREWKDSPQMKRLFMSKLTREFNDLIGAKAAKGIIEEITIKSYSFGDTLPIIKDVRLIGIRSQSSEDVPDGIDLALNITYSGGFYVSADFALALNKSVYLSIKVVEITGKIKLSFRRNPASHWSFSFFEDPEPKIELDAESRFQGKNIQQLTSLLVRHFKKVIRRKYVLPNYVIRYKPFLSEKVPQHEQNNVYVHNSQITVGSLVVTVVGCSRLPLQKKSSGHMVFCSLSTDSTPFAERKNANPALWPVSQCEVFRGNERKVGLTFHEVECVGDASRKKIVIDTVDPDSPAGYSSLKEGDVILEINDKSVIDAKQMSQLIKTSNRLNIVVKRPPSHMSLSESEELCRTFFSTGDQTYGSDTRDAPDDNDTHDETYIDEEFINIVMPLINMGSYEKGGDDSVSCQPKLSRHEIDASPEKSSSKRHNGNAQATPILFKNSQSVNETEDFLPRSIDECRDKTVNTATEKCTKAVKLSKTPLWNEKFELNVEKEQKYLNVLVWYQVGVECNGDDNDQEQRTKDILLGYVTISLTDIAVRCLQTGDRFHQQDYVLVSTAYDRVFASRSNLQNHPGLKKVTCGGDITLSFIYKPSFDSEDKSSVKSNVYTSQQIDNDWDEHTVYADNNEFEVTKHNFVDTQFHHATNCNFCNKKVWTKSAYHCRYCGKVCHKKCLQRASMYTQCYSHQTEATRNDEFDDDNSETHPNVDKDTQVIDEKTLKEQDVLEMTSFTHMSSAINKVKKVGKELYPDLSVTNRKLKLEEMIHKLQTEIDEENENKSKLYQMRKKPKPPFSLESINQSIAKSEQKSESLKLLMLQFCSGLENCESEV